MSTIVRASTDGCSIHVQIFKPTGDQAGRYYTVKELGERWKRHPVTVKVWLGQMRRSGREPTQGQVRLHRRNSVRRWLLIRDDYAGLMRAIFMDRTIKL